VRAVLDPNILVSALLSRAGAPAQLLARWLAGEFELVVSEQLLAELEQVFLYPKLRRRIRAEDAADFVAALRRPATLAGDPPVAPPRRSSDPGDDYLVALAASERAALVSGDQHLLELADELPVYSARRFLETLERR
jgi:putative PIN family toxin of toxin-antitoxin system